MAQPYQGGIPRGGDDFTNDKNLCLSYKRVFQHLLLEFGEQCQPNVAADNLLSGLE